MLRVSRVFLGSGLLWLALASILGVLVVARPVLVRAPALDALRPLAVHVLVMGFAAQGIVALMLRASASTSVGGHDERLGWACLLSLNGGLALRVVSEPMLLLHALPPWGTLVLASALLEALACLGLVVVAWPRRASG